MNRFRVWSLLVALVLVTSIVIPVRWAKVNAAHYAQPAANRRGMVAVNERWAGFALSLIEDTPPEVSSTFPVDGSKNIRINASITVNFSEVVTVENGWFTIACKFGGPITANVEPEEQASSFTISPVDDLQGSDVCQVTIDHSRVTDVDETHDQMAADKTWHFYTEELEDPRPVVESSYPTVEPLETRFPAGQTLSVTFREPITLGSYTLRCNDSSVSVHPSTVDQQTYRFEPKAPLPLGSACLLLIPFDQVTDSDGQHMLFDFSLAFQVAACGVDYTPLNAIQQAGGESPLAGQAVTVEGIVTADFQESNQLNGFFLQSLPEDEDDDPSTSEGLFVYTGTVSADSQVSVGQHVRFEATVKEYTASGGSWAAGGMAAITELTSIQAGSLVVCEAHVGLPEPVQISLPADADPQLGLEAYEGMLVQINGPLTVQQNRFLGQFGQLTMGQGGRIFTRTNGTGGSADDYLRMVVLDDGSLVQNPMPLPYFPLPYPTLGSLRADDTVSELVGVLDQGRINSSTSASANAFPALYYRLHPTIAPVFQQANPRSQAANPPQVGGPLKVASINLHNFFVTLDNVTADNGLLYPVGSPYILSVNEPRGANTAEEFTRQRLKLVKALAAMHADVFGLVEIEAWDGANAVTNLVETLNAELGAPDLYAAVPDPASGVGGDIIQVALIYNTATLSRIGDSLSSPEAIFDRSPVAQLFQSKANQEHFWVVTNHFKSKTGCPASDTDPNADQGDGQGCWNAKRVAQAEALAAFITGSMKPLDPDVLVVGDLNAYGAEDPIKTLVGSGLINQVAARVPEISRYAYVFDGAAGYLDHVLSTPTFNQQITGVAFWHINADEPSMLDYNRADLFQPDPFASSDHDPVIVGVNLSSNKAPLAPAPLANQQAAALAQFSFTIPGDVFTDPDAGDLLTFSALCSDGNPLPAWLSFDPQTRTFTGTPGMNDVGTFTIRVTAADTSGAQVSQTFQLTILSMLYLPMTSKE